MLNEEDNEKKHRRHEIKPYRGFAQMNADKAKIG